MFQNNELLLVDQIRLASSGVTQEVRYKGAYDPNKTRQADLKNELPDKLLVVGDRITMEYPSCDSQGRVIKVERNVEEHSGRTVWKEIWKLEPYQK